MVVPEDAWTVWITVGALSPPLSSIFDKSLGNSESKRSNRVDNAQSGRLLSNRYGTLLLQTGCRTRQVLGLIPSARADRGCWTASGLQGSVTLSFSAIRASLFLQSSGMMSSCRINEPNKRDS